MAVLIKGECRKCGEEFLATLETRFGLCPKCKKAAETALKEEYLKNCKKLEVQERLELLEKIAYELLTKKGGCNCGK